MVTFRNGRLTYGQLTIGGILKKIQKEGCLNHFLKLKGQFVINVKYKDIYKNYSIKCFGNFKFIFKEQHIPNFNK